MNDPIIWCNGMACPRCQGIVYYDGPGCWPPLDWCEEEEGNREEEDPCICIPDEPNPMCEACF